MKSLIFVFLPFIIISSGYAMEPESKVSISNLPLEMRQMILSLVKSSDKFADIYKKLQALRLIDTKFKDAIDNPYTKKFLIDEFKKAHPGKIESELVWAINRGDLNTIKVLLHAGVNPSERIYSTYPLAHALHENKTEIIRFLLQAGAKPNIPGLVDTPLNMAIRNDNKKGVVEQAKDMVEAGAHINAQGALGATPLILAMVPFNAVALPNVALVRFLLEQGADPTIPGGNGQTPLQVAQQLAQIHAYAKEAKEIVELLKKYGVH